jgi:hypothetical protein
MVKFKNLEGNHNHKRLRVKGQVRAIKFTVQLFVHIFMFGLLRNVHVCLRTVVRALQSAVYLEEFVLKGETTFQHSCVQYSAQEPPANEVSKPRSGSLTERRQSPGTQCSATLKVYNECRLQLTGPHKLRGNNRHSDTPAKRCMAPHNGQ